MTLENAKNYLRIDSDLTEDDVLVNSLIEASKNYIESTTGKQYDDSDQLLESLSLLLISHWYSNRNIANKTSAIDEFPHTITAILTTIKYNSNYDEVI